MLRVDPSFAQSSKMRQRYPFILTHENLMNLNLHVKRPKLAHISWRELATVVLPSIALLLLAFWIASRYIKPSPPNTLVMSTGFATSPYDDFGKRYQAILAAHGVTLELKASQGASENLARLRDATQAVDVGFVQGGMATLAPGEKPLADAIPLVSLGSLTLEPLWVFYRPQKTDSVATELAQLPKLAGKRLAIGAQGSGTYKLGLELLAASGVTEKEAALLTMPGDQAVTAMRQKQVDAVFVVSPPDSQPVRDLMAMAGVKLMSFSQAAGYARRFPYLSKVTLPAGAIDFGKNIPPTDVDMVGTTVNLIARDSLHPALMYLLIDAATQVHKDHRLFQNEGEYPNRKGQDMPLADEADRFFKSGKPFFQRYLPYWLANLVDRMVVLLIPLIAVLVPLLKIMPSVYDYRLKVRIAKLYKQIRTVEHDINDAKTPAEVTALCDRLDEIETSIVHANIPVLDSDAFYQVRQALDLARDRIGRGDAKAAPTLRVAPLAGGLTR